MATAVDSLIGWASGTISAPAATQSDSPIGWASGTIASSTPQPTGNSDSPIGWAAGTTESAVDPRNIYHYNGTAVRRGVMCYWDGTAVQTVESAPAPTPATWRDAFAAATPAAPQNVYLMGSSLEYGAGATGATPPKWRNSYPGQMAATLDVGSTGMVLMNHATFDNPAWDPRLTKSSGVAKLAQGFHKLGAWRIPAGAYVEFTTTADRFVVYSFAVSGVPTITVDGAAVTPTLQAGHHAGHRVQEVATTLGQHTVRVAGPTDLWAIEGRDSRDACRVHNASISGQSLGTVGYGGSSHNDLAGGLYGQPVIDTLLAQGPGVAMSSLYVNEWTTGQTAATIEARLRAQVAHIRSHGVTPFMCVQPQPSPSLATTTTYTAVRDIMLAVAADLDVPLLDAWRLFATDQTATNEQTLHDQGVANGYFADSIHPNNVGAALLAGRVRDFLTGA